MRICGPGSEARFCLNAENKHSKIVRILAYTKIVLTEDLQSLVLNKWSWERQKVKICYKWLVWNLVHDMSYSL